MSEPQVIVAPLSVRPVNTTTSVLTTLQQSVCVEPVQIGIGYKSTARPAIIEQPKLMKISKIFRRDLNDENPYSKYYTIPQDQRIYHFGEHRPEAVKVFLFWLTQDQVPTLREIDALELGDVAGYQVILCQAYRLAKDYSIKVMANEVILSLFSSLRRIPMTREVLQQGLKLTRGDKLRELLLDEALQSERSGVQLLRRLDKRWLIGVDQDVAGARERFEFTFGRFRPAEQYLIEDRNTPEPEWMKSPQPDPGFDQAATIARLRKKAKQGHDKVVWVYIDRMTQHRRRRERAERAFREARTPSPDTTDDDRLPSPESFGRSPSPESDRIPMLRSPTPRSFPEPDGFGSDHETETSFRFSGPQLEVQRPKKRSRLAELAEEAANREARKREREAKRSRAAIPGDAPHEPPASCACYFDYRYPSKSHGWRAEPVITKCPECGLAKRPWDGFKYGWRDGSWRYVPDDADDGYIPYSNIAVGRESGSNFGGFQW